MAGETGYEFLVLRIHQEGLPRFMRERGISSVKTTRAGFRLRFVTPEDPTYSSLSRVALGAVGVHGIIPPHAVSHLEVAHRFRVPGLAIRPLAFQVHTHALGTAVTGWKVTPDGEWTLIARRNPQEAESFVPIARPDVVIREGDLIAARCTMNNTLDRVVLAR